LGAVTKNGQVVKSGVITFISKDGRGTALASIRKDGAYTAFNVPVGEATVILVNTVEVPDFDGPIDMAQFMKPNPSNKLAALKKSTVIPDKFGKPETSGLTMTVRSGDNHFDIDVGK